MGNAKNVVCLLLLVLAVATPAIAGRHFEFERKGDSQRYIRQYLHSTKKESSGFGWGLLCIPTTSQVLEDHEGRHKCAYDHPNGFRAVGVGYNLDDNVDTRRSELSLVFADYDKVYKNESCLWDIQITALLTSDTKRALDGADEAVEPFDNFCCDLQAVFADVQHSLGGLKSFPHKDMQTFIEKAAAREWISAADELKKTEWCNSNRARCNDNIATVKGGC